MMNSAKVLLMVQYVFIIWQSSVYSASRSVQPASGCFFFVLAQPSAADHRCSSRPLRTPKRPTQPPLLAGRCASPMVGEEGEGSRRNTTYRCRFTRVAAVRPRVLRLPLVLWTDQHRPLMSDSISTNRLDLQPLETVCQRPAAVPIPVAWRSTFWVAWRPKNYCSDRFLIIDVRQYFHEPSWPQATLTQSFANVPPLFLSQTKLWVAWQINLCLPNFDPCLSLNLHGKSDFILPNCSSSFLYSISPSCMTNQTFKLHGNRTVCKPPRLLNTTVVLSQTVLTLSDADPVACQISTAVPLTVAWQS